MRAFLVAVFVCLTAHSAALADNYLVLPFFNLSKNPSLDWVGESLSEHIREAMGSEGVLTLEREDWREAYRRLSVRPYSLLTKASVIRVAEFLDADQVIFGSFELTAPEDKEPKGRGTLRVLARILDLRKTKLGPEFIEVSPLEELARLQTHLAWQTLQFVTPSTAPSEQEFHGRQSAVRVDAIESYVRGLLADNPDQKVTMLVQAVRLEPRYSPANFQLGRLYVQKKAYRQAAEHLQRVLPSDMHYREASFLLGLSRFHNNDFDGAEHAFRIVADAVPLNEVWNNLGAAQSRKNSQEALESFRKALEGDATDPDYHFNVGYALYKAGDMEGAAERFRAVLERTPDDSMATLMLGRSLKSAGASSPPIHVEPMERLKQSYEESAYLQLKSLVERKK